ncbi:ras-related protein Rab-34 isoform X1 [Ranitomeya variabilis]|uniref:ras-related protein Rab-34 isoform X1 n=1 Tax=Ranitomeya variabilis TaxID=490064 RepID=UPI0040571B7C
MSVLPPVRRDRIVAELPQCFKKEACLHTRDSFHSKVIGACKQQRTGTVGRFKISKVIVVGDLSVGKTCMINRFCKDAFDKNYKATIGVDFEMERFEILGIPFSLQLWDTAGQERFKCIASTYYRGAQAIVIAFDLTDISSLEHTKQWLQDALRENDPSSVLLFLVGSKKDLTTPSQYALIERDALKVAKEMQAEYWSVSSLTGENVKEFFFRVASLTFETSVLAELEKTNARRIGDVVRINSNDSNLYQSTKKTKSKCCQ